jgi:uncharacterized protein (TIGR02147 family)
MLETFIMEVELIQQEWAQRRERNPALSLRSFARFLKVSPGRLSEILSGKRQISAEMADKIADRLGLNPEVRQVFLQSVFNRKRASVRSRFEQTRLQPTVEYQQLSMDAFHIISDWYHFAILNLRDCDDFKCGETWIAERLNLNTSEVKLALNRLERIGMIEWKKNMWYRTQAHIATSDGVFSAGLKKGHRGILEKALASLDDVEPIDRDNTNMTMAIDPAKMPKAKEAIKKFRRKFTKDFEMGGSRTEVYTLAIQFFPLTKVRKSPK